MLNAGAVGHGGEIEQCPNCRGIWLDATETEAALRQAGLAIVGIRPIEPSLEDVFISVLTEKEATAK